jgi:hypothetical protein
LTILKGSNAILTQFPMTRSPTNLQHSQPSAVHFGWLQIPILTKLIRNPWAHISNIKFLSKLQLLVWYHFDITLTKSF